LLDMLATLLADTSSRRLAACIPDLAIAKAAFMPLV
jgi:hypothetical protein